MKRIASLELELDYEGDSYRECVCDAETLDMYGCECGDEYSEGNRPSSDWIEDTMMSIYDALQFFHNRPTLDFTDDPTCAGEFQFRNAPDSVGAWRVIADRFSQRGWIPSRRCGAHVHVDVSRVPHATIMELVPVYMALESVLYTVAASGYDHRGEHYCHRVNSFLNVSRNGRVAEDKRGRMKVEIAAAMRSERYVGLNLTNILSNCGCGAVRSGMSELCRCEEKRTVEFRLWDSSLLPERLAVYVALSRGIVERVFASVKKHGYAPVPGFPEKYLLQCVPADLRDELQLMLDGQLKDRVV